MKITAKGTAEKAAADSRVQHGSSVRQGVDIRLSNCAAAGGRRYQCCMNHPKSGAKGLLEGPKVVLDNPMPMS
jgi:hypothetical protein